MSSKAQRGNVIELHNPDGSVSNYLRFSARLPKFLERYPPTEGWRIERSANHAMSACPDLVKLHIAAVSAGKSPKDLSLPPLPTGMVYECRLVNPEGATVMTATSLVTASDAADATGGYKHWEAGETNAFQRLVASLGFDGGMLDEDEATRQAQIGGVGRSERVRVGVEAVASDAESTTPASVKATANAPTSEVASAPEDGSAPRAARAPQEADLLKGLQRQIDMVARQKKRDAGKAKTVAEARKLLADLIDAPQPGQAS